MSKLDPNKLMIGNLVRCKGKVKPVLSINPKITSCTVGSKDKCAIGFPLYENGEALEYVGAWLTRCEPVEITPEILGKIKLKKSRYDIGKKMGFYITPTGEPIGPMMYVHELQNAYLMVMQEHLNVEMLIDKE